jgi:hypothetical protein
MNDVNQSQSGTGSYQGLAVGAAGKGTSNVTAHDVNQTQTGNGSWQYLDVGSVN